MIFRKNVEYVAQTDGRLRNNKNRSFGLIEVKPRSRGNDISIQMQEAAQIAAWISENDVVSHDPSINCEYGPPFPRTMMI